MDAKDALDTVRQLATSGRVLLTNHAKQRMAVRGMAADDVRHALMHAERCKPTDDPDRWRIDGPDSDGDDLTAIAVVEAGVIVITVF